MSCNNCFNNCAEIVSDKCVRYTGADVETLGISNGDNLLQVEQVIINKILDIISATGIYPIANVENICQTFIDLLPESPTLLDYIDVFLIAICNNKSEIDDLTAIVSTIQSTYDLPACITDNPSDIDTHAVLQSALYVLCDNVTAITDLLNLIQTNYSENGPQLDAYIENYLNTHNASTTLQSNKMVPYVAYEFYGSLSGKFDANGVGLVGSDWENIYICNGQNGTPDKRGRVAVGATDSPGPAIVDPVTNPAIPGNPIYSAATPGGWTEYGSNLVVLNSTQVPNHSHGTVVNVTGSPHFHYVFNTDAPGGAGAPGVTSTNYATVNHETDDNLSYRIKGTATSPTLAKTSDVTSTPGVTVSVDSTSGGGNGHSNIQPVIAAFYIMYIP